jgi:glycosyltransferase involved in cell wall biosynthesis
MYLGHLPIEILPNPVDTDLFKPRPEEVQPFRVFFAGTIIEKKGVRELCFAMSAVLARHPETKLLLAGRDGPVLPGSPSMRSEIERSLDDTTNRCIQFLGPCSRSEMANLMASAAVCVFPSHMETQGIVICEAMACARPVIVTNRGPGPEVMGPNGECGLLIDPSDPGVIASAITKILDSPEQARLMGANGRNRAVSCFSLDRTISRNIEFYKRNTFGNKLERPLDK